MGEFIGQFDIKQVMQPEGTELCFAAVVSAVTELPIHEAHSRLVVGEVSEHNGQTAASTVAQEVAIDDDAAGILTIEPVGSPFDGEALLERINKKFEAGNAVALLHKKNDNPEDTRNHWILLTGRHENAGTLSIGVMDPLATSRELAEVSQIEEMIERTIELNGGVFACALSVSRPE